MEFANLLSTRRERERDAQMGRITNNSADIPSGSFTVQEMWMLFCVRGILGTPGAGLNDADLEYLERRITEINLAKTV